VDEDDRSENRELEDDIAQEDDMKSDKLSEENDEFSMNDEEISKKRSVRNILLKVIQMKMIKWRKVILNLVL
jgi:hypothetical protein